MGYFTPVKRAPLPLLLIASVGCTVVNAYEDPVIVGQWKHEQNADTRMDIDVDGDGDSRIRVVDPPGSENRYDLDWEQADPNEFEITFKCRSSAVGCEMLDFVMDCDASRSGNDLDCTPRSGWIEGTVFNWERDD